MGNFEKVVVLLILLVCAIVLGISLRSPGPEIPQEGSSTATGGELPEDSLRQALAESQRTGGSAGSETRTLRQSVGQLGAPARSEDESRDAESRDAESRATESGAAARGTARRIDPPAGRDPLLFSGVDPDDDRHVALRRMEGLRETVSPDFMLYTCRAGDDWASLAETYYGSRERASLLQVANETLEELRPNDRILVPVYELEQAEAQHEPAEPREAPEFSWYVVRSGDSLSTISSEQYGTGSRWMEIYDANRDVLDDPHSLKVGQKLRIP